MSLITIQNNNNNIIMVMILIVQMTSIKVYYSYKFTNKRLIFITIYICGIFDEFRFKISTNLFDILW